MNRHVVKVFAVVAAFVFMSITVLELSAHARAGGRRSFGSRGSRSYYKPKTNPNPGPGQQSRQWGEQASRPNPFQQQQTGSFMRNMAGGIVGGLLGGMLFRSLGFAGPGGGMADGSGIGLFEIVLLVGAGYLIFRYIKKKRENSPSARNVHGEYKGATVTSLFGGPATNEPLLSDASAGLVHIRQTDPSFDESRFNDTVMDIFFKVQGGWMNRDLSPVSGLLTDEIKRIFQEDLDRLLRDKQVNRLENIAVRKVEIAEAWQESGQDFITALIYANLLDYTTDDSTGAVVSGSKTDPVKFEEYWTVTRPVGTSSWRLSAISQTDN